MHYAEGLGRCCRCCSRSTPTCWGDAAAALKPRVDSEIANNLSYMENALNVRDFFVGKDLTGADIQILFVLEAAGARLDPYPGLAKYRARMQARPAYKRGNREGRALRPDEPITTCQSRRGSLALRAEGNPGDRARSSGLPSLTSDAIASMFAGNDKDEVKSFASNSRGSHEPYAQHRPISAKTNAARASSVFARRWRRKTSAPCSSGRRRRCAISPASPGTRPNASPAR